MHYTEEEDKKQTTKTAAEKVDRDKQKSRATVVTQKSDKSKESVTKGNMYDQFSCFMKCEHGLLSS